MSPIGSTVLSRRPPDSMLMPPPPPPKRRKRPSKVLDEDVYSEALSYIIARDFFPGLLESEAQEEYLQALDSHNNDWIREAGRRLTDVMKAESRGRRRTGGGTISNPRANVGTTTTPLTLSAQRAVRTPSTVMRSGSPSSSELNVDVDLSLGAFQARYTSEDNESFNALLDEQNEKTGSKYAFFHHGNRIPTARQIAYQAKLGQSEAASALSTRPMATTAAGEMRSTMASAGPSHDVDARQASVDGFPSREGPRNHFMFEPDGVEETVLTRAQEAEFRSGAPPKCITYSGTRLQTCDEPTQDAVPSSPSLSAVEAAIDGRLRATQSEVGYTGADTPRVNGYTFVDAERTPSSLGVPIADEEADAAERAAVMQLLPKAAADGPNPFKIAPQSRREAIHACLVEKADSARRKDRGIGRLEQLRHLGVTPRRTPTPRFASAPRSSMTPAGRRLAEKIGSPYTARDPFASGITEFNTRRTRTPRIRSDT